MSDHNNKVLFLEDEPTIREVLKEYMSMSDYEVTEADNGDTAIQLLDHTEQGTYDLAILDIMVPGASGYDVLAHIKEKYPDMATIMLTALDDDQSQVHAFNLFADDYVIKPVSPIILLKRMEAVLRRTQLNKNKEVEGSISTPTTLTPASAETSTSTASCAHTGSIPSSIQSSDAREHNLVLHNESYTVFYNGHPLQLTLSEFLLLQTLYENPQRVFTREQLILHIYNEDYIGNDRIIDAHVKNLRKKLPVACIRTVIGVGYQYQQED